MRTLHIYSTVRFFFTYLLIFFNWKTRKKEETDRQRKPIPLCVIVNNVIITAIFELHIALNRFINKPWITFVIAVAQITFEWFVTENGKCDRFLFLNDFHLDYKLHFFGIYARDALKCVQCIPIRMDSTFDHCVNCYLLLLFDTNRKIKQCYMYSPVVQLQFFWFWRGRKN